MELMGPHRSGHKTEQRESELQALGGNYSTFLLFGARVSRSWVVTPVAKKEGALESADEHMQMWSILFGNFLEPVMLLFI